jgi:TonB family protein
MTVPRQYHRRCPHTHARGEGPPPSGVQCPHNLGAKLIESSPIFAERRRRFPVRGAIAGPPALSLACSSGRSAAPARSSAGGVDPAPRSEPAPPPEGSSSTVPVETWRVVGREESKTRCDRVDPPVLRSRSEPRYPEDVRRDRLEGTVVLKATISSDGVPRSIHIVQSPHARLSDLASDALRSSRYRPAECDGSPVESYITAAFTFALGG